LFCGSLLTCVCAQTRWPSSSSQKWPPKTSRAWHRSLLYIYTSLLQICRFLWHICKSTCLFGIFVGLFWGLYCGSFLQVSFVGLFAISTGLFCSSLQKWPPQTSRTWHRSFCGSDLHIYRSLLWVSLEFLKDSFVGLFCGSLLRCYRSLVLISFVGLFCIRRQWHAGLFFIFVRLLCIFISLFCGSLLNLYRSLLWALLNLDQSLLWASFTYLQVTFVHLLCTSTGLFCGSLWNLYRSLL